MATAAITKAHLAPIAAARGHLLRGFAATFVLIREAGEVLRQFIPKNARDLETSAIKTIAMMRPRTRIAFQYAYS